MKPTIKAIAKIEIAKTGMVLVTFNLYKKYTKNLKLRTKNKWKRKILVIDGASLLEYNNCAFISGKGRKMIFCVLFTQHYYYFFFPAFGLDTCKIVDRMPKLMKLKTTFNMKS